jgi:hypothetical protein
MTGARVVFDQVVCYTKIMKIPFKKTYSQKAEQLLRRCGYARQYDKKLDKFSYFRRLGTQHFPKFHVYVTSESPLELDLHLDHKAHAYAGQKAHGGDYDSDVVRAEALRIWNVIQEEVQKPVSQEKKKEESKGFFGKLFG